MVPNAQITGSSVVTGTLQASGSGEIVATSGTADFAAAAAEGLGAAPPEKTATATISEPEQSAAVTVKEYEVKPGDTIYRVIRVNRLRVCETDPDTLVIDGAKVRWHFEEPKIVAPGKIGADEYRRPVVIPMQASPGSAEMRVSSTFVCNPVHRIWPIRMVHEPLKFKIVPP